MSGHGFFARLFRRQTEPTPDSPKGRKGRRKNRTAPPIEDLSGFQTPPEERDDLAEPWYRQSGPLFDESFIDRPAAPAAGPVAAAPEEPSFAPEATGPAPSVVPGSVPVIQRIEPIPETAAPAAPEPIPAPAPPQAAVLDPFAPPRLEEDPSGVAAETESPGEPAPEQPPADAENAEQYEPPMVVPIRGYYLTRGDDTLRSVAAQFLNAPERWSELRSLNAAYPGIAEADADELLSPGTALALPGDPLPWGRQDPVNLWTLAETLLFTAWGREPTPEEVVPFWRGLTRGALPEGQQAAPGHELPGVAEIEARGDTDAEVTRAEAAESRMPPPIEMPAAAFEVSLIDQALPTEAAGDEAAEDEADQEAVQPVDPAEPPEPAEDSELVDEIEQILDSDAAGEELLDAEAPETIDEAPSAEPAFDEGVEPEPTEPEPTEPELHEEQSVDVVEDALEYGDVAYADLDIAEAEIIDSSDDVLELDETGLDQTGLDETYLVTDDAAPVATDTDLDTDLDTGGIGDADAVDDLRGEDPPPPVVEPEAPPWDAPITDPRVAPLPPAMQPPAAVDPGGGGGDAALAPPPAFEDWLDEAPEFPGGGAPSAPYAGLPSAGTPEASTVAPEAEAPRVPHFLPSVTQTSPSQQPQAARSSVLGRSLAGTAVGDAMMLWQLARRRRYSRQGATAPDAIEHVLQQTAASESLELIEAAMRHLYAVTVGQQRIRPNVLAVRIGTYGLEVLLHQPVETPPGWRSASGGFVLELPQGVTAHDLSAIGSSPSLCPALVPVGNTYEGPLLLNLEQLGCLAVSGPSIAAAGLLSAIVSTLGSSPMAENVRITAVGLDHSAGMIGWEAVTFTSFDSPELETLLASARSPLGDAIELLVIGPGNDLLIQRAGQVAAAADSRLALVGATSAVSARWPWRIHVDETGTAVVHPIAIAMTAARAMQPEVVAEFVGVHPLGPR